MNWFIGHANDGRSRERLARACNNLFCEKQFWDRINGKRVEFGQILKDWFINVIDLISRSSLVKEQRRDGRAGSLSPSSMKNGGHVLVFNEMLLPPTKR